jgi:hypothetical protein
VRFPDRSASSVSPSAIYTLLEISRIPTEPCRAPRRKENLMPTSVAACVCEQLTVSCSGDPAQERKPMRRIISGSS